MNRRMIAAIVAGVLALLGGALLISYVQGADNRAIAGQQPQNVLVVTAPIAKGTTGEEAAKSVVVRQLPAAVIVPGALTNAEELKGKVAATDLIAGEQVAPNRFVDPSAAEAVDVVDVPKGLQQLSIVLPAQKVIGAHLRAGDKVGIFMSFEFQDVKNKDAPTVKTTHLTLSDVLVTRVAGVAQTNASGTGEAPGQNVMVTLAVKAPAAERIVFAAEWGKLWLSLQREGTDNSGTELITGGNVYK